MASNSEPSTPLDNLHACQCDECKLLDAQDLESLRLANDYLNEKLALDDWWDAEILNEVGDKGVAINKFNSSIGAENAPNSLSTMISCLYYSFNEHERGPFVENVFKQLLRQLIEGYETRMRTVHLGGDSSMNESAVWGTRRFQRKRTKGWKMPPNTVYVGRLTRFGNPWAKGQQILPSNPPMTLQDVMTHYRLWILANAAGPERYRLPLRKLRGKNLACWCPLDQPCHADVLLRIANED